MIHRALCGSIERFFAILIEHFGGAFPTWLAPVQALIIPVNESCLEYASKLNEDLIKLGFRVELNSAEDSFNKKIRNGVTQKIPNILIVGNNEVENGSVTLRRYAVKEQLTLSKEALIEMLKDLVNSRAIERT
jgi:threonyl-tRNA synthetase